MRNTTFVFIEALLMEAASNNYGLAFAPNRSKKNLLLISGILGAFMLGGFIVFIAGLVDSNLMELKIDTKTGHGGGVFGVALAFLLMVHFLTAPLNVSYYVGKEGLALKQGKKVLPIPYADIESLTHLREDQGEAFILQLQHKLVSKQRQIVGESGSDGILDVFREQKRSWNKYKFLSVAVVYSSSGRQRGPKRANKADLPCDTIFILQKNGEGYLISPLDIEGFMNEANKQMNIL